VHAAVAWQAQVMRPWASYSKYQPFSRWVRPAVS
jgi:hypothetical protein